MSEGTIQGNARITLRPGDNRRVFVYLVPGMPSCVGILSLAEHIWVAKGHLNAIKDACFRWSSSVDKNLIFPSGLGESGCIPIGLCVDWLLKHCHKSSVAQKKLKKFIADEWEFIKAMPERIIENSDDRVITKAWKRLRGAVDNATYKWRVDHKDILLHMDVIQPSITALTCDDVFN